MVTVVTGLDFLYQAICGFRNRCERGNPCRMTDVVPEHNSLPSPISSFARLTCYWPGVYIRSEMWKVRDYEARP